MSGGRQLPTSSKNLRACLMCAILLTREQFARSGCPNCESILRTSGKSVFPFVRHVSTDVDGFRETGRSDFADT